MRSLWWTASYILVAVNLLHLTRCMLGMCLKDLLEADSSNQQLAELLRESETRCSHLQVCATGRKRCCSGEGQPPSIGCIWAKQGCLALAQEEAGSALAKEEAGLGHLWKDVG